MTDNEIVKALERCSTYGGSCSNCPAYVKVDRSNCNKVLVGALDIINRQKAEIEKNENIIRLADKTIEAQNAEIERLNRHNGILKDRVSRIKEKVEVESKIAKAEAIKEFAEKLKLHSYIVSDESQRGIINRYSVVTANQIDNLVKEMVGGVQ